MFAFILALFGIAYYIGFAIGKNFYYYNEKAADIHTYVVIVLCVLFVLITPGTIDLFVIVAFHLIGVHTGKKEP